MKKSAIILCAATALTAASGIAQYVRINLSNGESVEYKAEEVASVEFLPENIGVPAIPISPLVIEEFNDAYHWTRNEAWFGRNFWEGVFMSGDEAVGCNYNGVYDDSGRYRLGALHQFTPDMPGVGLMGDMLNGIAKANELMAKYADSEIPNVTAPLRAIRAYYTFWMMELYGDVPIYGNADYYLDVEIGRSPRAEVARWIEAELLEAIPYLTAENNESTYGLPNKWMAEALLAKLYLNWNVYTADDIQNFDATSTNEKLDACIAICDDIIKSGVFSVGEGYRQKFFPNNGVQITDFIYAVDFDPERIGNGEWKYAGGHEMNRWWDYRKATMCKPNFWGWKPEQSLAGIFILTPEAVDRFCLEGDERNEVIAVGPQNAYDENFNRTEEPVIVYQDARFRKEYGPLDYKKDFEWDNIATLDLGSEDELGNLMKGARCVKYPVEQEADVKWERKQRNDIPVFRYADILLTKAECMLKKGNMAEAVRLVNEVRVCSHAPMCTSLTLDELLDERGREFILEPWRRNDLIRFGKFENCAKWKTEASPATMADKTKRLLPIPTGDLESHPSWTQNPGY